MKKRLAVLLVLLAAAGATAAWLSMRLRQPYRGYTAPEQFVDIPPGVGTRAIGERLVSAGVIRDRVTYRIALLMSHQATRLKAGEYRFTEPMTPSEVISKLSRGDVYVVSVTFPEGLTIAEMAKHFEAKGLGPSEAFAEAAGNPSLVRDLDPAARDLEGYLFPETYSLPRHADASQLVRLMVERFEQVFTDELREAARVRQMSPHQVVTLASIVEKETGKSEERPLIAAVYENRLRIGMGLQCDPTVIYALQRAGAYTGNLRREDLSFDSPYNTYRYAGLPPGPIASPGRASIEAVVRPADADYLYFVSRNDGSHAFAATLEQHNRNVRTYQVDYFRDQRARTKAEGQEGRRAGGAGRD
jgi:UPF0755 protein